MKIAALLIANASAVMVGYPTNYTTPYNATAEEVDIAVHIYERDGMPTDEWIVIDTLAHGDDDDDHDVEGGWCDNVFKSEYGWIDEDGNEQSSSYAICEDMCFKSGGVIEEKFDQHEHGWSRWYECVDQECDDFEHVYTWEDEDGTMQESRWCDAGCMLSGGFLEDFEDEASGNSWK